MPRKPKPRSQRPITKRQLSRWQRERQIQRTILFSGVFIIILVLGIIGYGYYNTGIKPFREPAIRVNSTIYNMGYYINMLNIIYGGNTSLPPTGLADYTVAFIQQNELIRQNAAELGIVVSSEEIDKKLSEYNFANDQEHRDIVAANLTVEKIRNDYFSAKVTPMAPQVHLLAMLLESEAEVETIRTRIEGGEEFTALARELSQDNLSRTKGGDLGWLPQEYANIWLPSPVLEAVAFSLPGGELSQPVYDEAVTRNIGYWIIEVVEKKINTGEDDSGGEGDTEKVRVRAILLGSRQEAEMVREKLKAGEDFATLAGEFSQDPLSNENGGDLGWLERESKNKALENTAFSLNPNVLSEPIRDEDVQTNGGYWLIQVQERDDNKKIEKEQQVAITNKLLNDWVSQLLTGAEDNIESYLDEGKKTWAINQTISKR